MTTLNRKIICQITETDNIIESVCTHCAFSITNLDTELLTRMYNHKSENRQTKALFSINAHNVATFGSKFVIKMTMDYGMDGLVLDNVNNDNVLSIIRLLQAIIKLPSPYNFHWDIFLGFENTPPTNTISQLCTILKKIKENNLFDAISGIIVPDSFLQSLTDNQFDPHLLLVYAMETKLDTQLDNVKNNKFGGMYCNNPHTCRKIHQHLKHSLVEHTNHLDYPTSRFIKDCQVGSIIEAYTGNEETMDCRHNGQMSVVVNIDFLTK